MERDANVDWKRMLMARYCNGISSSLEQLFQKKNSHVEFNQW